MKLRALLLASALAGLSAPGHSQSGRFQHVIILFQENRSTDNLFGSNPNFEPNVDIATSGLNLQGQSVPLTAEPLDGCYDPSHGHGQFVVQYDNGKLDGSELVKTHSGNKNCKIPPYATFKYVTNSSGEIQPYFDLAQQYGFANRMFQTNQGPSFPAHQFIFGATSAPTVDSPLFVSENMQNEKEVSGCTAPADQRVKVIDASGNEKSNPPIYPCFVRPTLIDGLKQAGLSWRYYLNNNRVDGIWDAPLALNNICVAKLIGNKEQCTGPDYIQNVTTKRGQVIKDIRNCNLPAVSWVMPDAAESDHAGANEGRGPDWVASIVNLVGKKNACPSGETYWQDTAIFVTWDDWGGWYDHVPPFHTGGWGGDHNWGAGYTYGFRVPLLVISAYTPRGYVDNNPQDFGSILKFIEQNFQLSAIGPGYYADAYGGDMSGYFTLQAPRSFNAIATKHNADFFLYQEKPSRLPVDDD